MKHLLITGFEPFGGQTINPAWEAVHALPDQIGDWTLEKLQIPTVFGTAADMVLERAKMLQPQVILSIGQAGGRDAVTPELVAINLRHAKIPDNAGFQPEDIPVIPGGENAYFSSLPVRRMTKAIEQAGVPAKVSYSAGAYVCNDVFYTLLHHYKADDVRIGFIHVPFLPEQGQPSLPLEQIVHALTIAIEQI